MSIGELLRELRPNALWWLIDKLAGATFMMALLWIIQRIREVPPDWWVMGSLFVVSLLFLVYADVRGSRDRLWSTFPSSIKFRWGLPYFYGIATATCFGALFVFFGVPKQPQLATERRLPIGNPSLSDVEQNQEAIVQARDEGKQEEVKIDRTADQGTAFVSLLNSFPYSFQSRKRVTIRSNSSSYNQAKTISRWFKAASWTLVELDNVESGRFGNGITIRASFDNGDAENIHVALCRLGYQVSRAVDYSLLASDSVTLEIGELPSQK